MKAHMLNKHLGTCWRSPIVALLHLSIVLFDEHRSFQSGRLQNKWFRLIGKISSGMPLANQVSCDGIVYHRFQWRNDLSKSTISD